MSVKTSGKNVQDEIKKSKVNLFFIESIDILSC